MVFGVIMLVLALGVIIGTRYYLKYMDARSAAGRCRGGVASEKDGRDQKVVRFRRSKKAINTENIWGIEDIRNAVIVCSGGWYEMFLKIGSIDFHMMNEGEQTMVESALMATAVAIDGHLQLFSTVELCDTKGCALAIRDALYSEDFQQGKMTDYAINMYNYLDSLMQNRNIYNRPRYIIVNYHTLEGYEHARQELLRAVQVLQNSLLRAKINVSLLSSDQVADALFRYCNRGRMFLPSEAVAAGAMNYYVTGRGALHEEG